jgi:hypothetical protein
VTAAIPTPDTTATTATADPAEIVVTVPDGSRAAATLSCRLHGVINGAGVGAALTVVVEAGERADDADVARVLTCARECAASRGLGFVVR